MAVSQSSMAQLARQGVNEAQAPDADFKKKYGIAPKGKEPKGGWPASAYGFPLPPSGHPEALNYAHRVVSRAHQNKKYPADKVAAQVKRAQAIIKKHNPEYKPEEAMRSKFAGSPAREASRSKRESGATNLRESLCFQTTIREADIEKGTARIIIIREGPGNTADKHFYSAECLQDAFERKIFEGQQNFVDHPTKLEDEIIPERMVEKMGGWFEDIALAECENDAGEKVSCLEGTFVPEPGNEFMMNKLRAAAKYAERFPGRDYIGFSINAIGVGVPAEINGKRYNRVDRISEVRSVDLVTQAGAGGKLLQLKESAKMKEADKKREASKKLVAAFKGALKEAGVGLSKEQDEEVDKALGIVDGGKLDEVLDSVLCADGEGEAAVEDDEMEAEEAGDEADHSDAGDASDDLSDENDDEDDDLESMDEADLRKALKAARKSEREAKKSVKEARKSEKKAAREAQSARMKVQGILRERNAADIMDQLKIPDAHRGRLMREMRAVGTFREMNDVAKEYANAFLGGSDRGAGAPGSTSTKRVTLECFSD